MTFCPTALSLYISRGFSVVMNYRKIVLSGLAVAVWFGVFAHAAHDIWAASTLYSFITVLALIFCLGRSCDKLSVKFPLLFPCLAFIISGSLSLRGSYDMNTGLLELWGWGFVFLTFYLFINVTETWQDVEFFFSLAGSVVVPMGLICLWQQITTRPDQYGRWEIHGTLNNAIVLAGFVLYWILFYWRKTKMDLRYGVFLLSCFVLICLARSWWSWISLFMGYVIYYEDGIKRWVKDHKQIVAVPLALMLAILVVVLVYKLRINFGPYVGVGRLFYWYTAIRMWEHHPWKGIGLGGYATAYLFFKAGPQQNTLFSHSFPLQLLSEVGAIGMVAVIWFVMCYTQLLSKTGKLAQANSNVLTYKATLLIVLCFSLLSINLDYFLNKIMLFFVLGSTLVGNKNIRAYRIRSVWMVGSSLCLLLISPFWLKMFVASQLYTSGVQYEKYGDLTKAEKVYKDAISLDPSLADGYGALSEIYWKKYQQDHFVGTASDSIDYLSRALHFKKDIRLFQMLKHYHQQISSSPKINS